MSFPPPNFLAVNAAPASQGASAIVEPFHAEQQTSPQPGWLSHHRPSLVRLKQLINPSHSPSSLVTNACLTSKLTTNCLSSPVSTRTRQAYRARRAWCGLGSIQPWRSRGMYVTSTHLSGAISLFSVLLPRFCSPASLPAGKRWLECVVWNVLSPGLALAQDGWVSSLAGRGRGSQARLKRPEPRLAWVNQTKHTLVSCNVASGAEPPSIPIPGGLPACPPSGAANKRLPLSTTQCVTSKLL